MFKRLDQLEKALKYNFKNRDYLKEALMHRSYATEQHINYDNQRLEFLGDAVVQIIVTDYLYRKYRRKQEGEMTALRSALVKKESLAELARCIKLEKYILIGKGETEAGGNKKDSVLCDAFEALMGAMYLDSSIAVCTKFLLELINETFPDMNKVGLNQNPKGFLQEITQRKFQDKPVYKVKDTHGPEHNMTYIVEVYLDDKYLAEGAGKNIKAAEKAAALEAIKQLE